MINYDLEKRRFILSGVAIAIITVYLIRLFALQIASDDYRKRADSNAFLKKIEFPSRGIITDRKGKLLVYNQPAYDIMVVMNEEKGRLDTLEFCKALNITKDFFVQRMKDIKDRTKNPGYSRFTQQLFMGQLSDKEFSSFQEKLYRFPGFYIQKRSIRQYSGTIAGHVILKLMIITNQAIISVKWELNANTRENYVDRKECKFFFVMLMGVLKEDIKMVNTTSDLSREVICN